MENKVYYTDADVKAWVHSIIRGMQADNWRPDYIVGITRGGVVPANMLSQYLSIPLKTLNVSLRDDNDGPESNLWMAEDAYGYNGTLKNILIVDDINDSGATMQWIVNDWPSGCLPKSPTWDTVWHRNVKFATLINNEASKFKSVDYAGKFINKKETPEWCVFPWEAWWE